MTPYANYYPWGIIKINFEQNPVDRSAAFPPELTENKDAEAGSKLFEEHCLRCHAVNRLGGRVGPELNVPMNITEYRDRKILRQFIKNPQAFRHTAMPAHDFLSDEERELILDYLVFMKDHKKDTP